MVLVGPCSLLSLNGSIQFDQKPLSLGIIGLMEVIPAISMALFAMCRSKGEKKVAFQMYFRFSIISLGLFLFTLFF
jgi:hypothetical protein